MSLYQLEDSLTFAGGNVLIQGGYKPVLNIIQQEISMLTNREVKKVYYDGTNATVTVIHHTENGPEEQIYMCDYVVCTTSLGVLKKSIELPVNSMAIGEIEKGLIQFEPPLPEWKQNSLRCFDIGLMDKVIMQFPFKFWKDLGRIVYYSVEPGEYPWFDVQPGEVPVLLAWTACRYADKCEREMPKDEQVIQHCMSILRKVFPDAPNPCNYHVTRWRNNPFTRGAYSFILAGSERKNLSGISEPVENVYFAGEACAKSHLGMVHG